MLCQPLFLLINIELLYIEEHLLLQTRPVIINPAQLGQTLFHTCPHTSGTLTLILRYLAKKLRDTVDPHSEESLKLLTLDPTVRTQCLNSLLKSFHSGIHLRFVSISDRLDMKHIRKPHKHTEPI